LARINAVRAADPAPVRTINTPILRPFAIMALGYSPQRIAPPNYIHAASPVNTRAMAIAVDLTPSDLLYATAPAVFSVASNTCPLPARLVSINACARSHPCGTPAVAALAYAPFAETGLADAHLLSLRLRSAWCRDTPFRAGSGQPIVGWQVVCWLLGNGHWRWFCFFCIRRRLAVAGLRHRS